MKPAKKLLLLGAKKKARSSLLNDLVFSLKWDGSNFVNAVTGLAMANHGSVARGDPIVPGVADSAVFVSANSKYLSTPDTDDLSVGDIDFTASVWVNHAVIDNSTQHLMGQYLSTGDQRGWSLQYDGAAVGKQKFLFAVSATGTTTIVSVSATVPSPALINTPYLVLAWHDATANTINIQINNGTVYSTNHATGVLNSSGDFTIGAIANPTFYANANISGEFWKRKLTDAEKTAYYNGGSGIKHPFDLPATNNKQLIFDGNSMTDGAYSSYPGTAFSSLGGGWFYRNYGVSGQTTIGMIADGTTQIDPLFNAAYAKNVVVCWEGTNDLKLGATRADAQARLVQYCQARQAAGFKVVIVTILPRTQVGLPETFEADRIAINTYIRENYATFADVVADVAANTDIGEAGDSDNTTYYTDGVHMTTAGYNIVAGVVASAIEAA